MTEQSDPLTLPDFMWWSQTGETYNVDTYGKWIGAVIQIGSTWEYIHFDTNRCIKVSNAYQGCCLLAAFLRKRHKRYFLTLN